MRATWHSVRRHTGGFALVLVSLATLAVLPWLPARSASRLDLPFLKEARADTVVAFAGFVGCGTVCPLGLQRIGDAYDRSGQADVDLLFINIERVAEARQSAQWAQAFHTSFRAHVISDPEAALLHTALGLKSYPDIGTALSHTGFIYVFHRDERGWTIAAVFRDLPDTERLATTIRTLES